MSSHDPNLSPDDPSPDESGNEQPKKKIFTEDAKAPQTSHWDLDYLPREAVEDAYAEKDDTESDDDSADSK